MTAEEFKEGKISESIEEQVEIYTEAVIELYKRLLDHACVVFDPEIKDYNYFWQMVNIVYYRKNLPLGPNLEELYRKNTDQEQLLQILEKTYKDICVIYKGRYNKVLAYSYDNELNSEARIVNSLPDPADCFAFEKLLKNYGQRVFEKVSDLAAAGDISAQVLLGKSHFLGWGTPVGLDEGMFWLKKAAESGNGAALFYAGRACEYVMRLETGVCLNTESADYYHAALADGFTEAAYALYRYYKSYVSGKNGAFRAKKWLKKGKELGSAYCLYEEYQKPEGCWATNNVKSVVDWIKAAAHFGISDAMELLGDLYLKGHAGLKVDFDKAESLIDGIN